jgi:peptide/nickel transport system ATP-binding protein
MTDPLIEVENLTKYFFENDSIIDRLFGEERVAIRAVDGISFDIDRGETLGLVGESGCGKSTAGETLLRLQEPTDGTVRFGGESVSDLDTAELAQFRRNAAIVFQDPFSSLDPRMTIGETVKQPLDVHDWPRTDPAVDTDATVTTEGIDPARVDVTVEPAIDKVVTPKDGVATATVAVERIPDGADPAAGRGVAVDGEIQATVAEDLAVSLNAGDRIEVVVSVDRSDRRLRRERVRELLERVGLSGDQFDRYPHEFSGGQRQRIGIARALALDPEFVVLDEPTSALDVSVQAQVLNLLEDLQAEFGLTYLLISHDLSVIRHICDRVAVMYLGELVEVGPSEAVFSDPQHPYTEALLESVPRANTAERNREINTLTGDVPSPRDPPSGCRFRTRCPAIIPPADLDLSQSEYRAVATVRDRIRGRDIDVEGAREYVGASDAAGSEAVVDRLVDLLVDVDLPEPHRERVRTAVGEFAAGDPDAAAEVLSAYGSVCERVAPELPPDRDHSAACHLRDQPTAVTSEVNETDVAESPHAE